LSQILLTGATGFIGRRLLAPGWRPLVRRPAGLAEECVGDLLDPASLARACEGVEAVVHCAGEAEASRFNDAARRVWEVNVTGTKNLLEAAGRAGVKRFVLLSSVKAMAEPGEACADEDWPAEPQTAYGRSKRAAEEVLWEASTRWGLEGVVLRLPLVYGRGNRGNLWRMADLIRRGRFPPLPEVGNRRSLVHVEDVVAAVRLVLDHPLAAGRTYFVADPKPYSSRELYDAIREALGMPPLRWAVPAAVFRFAARLSPHAAETVDKLLGSACYSPARIERELGFRARVGLQVGLREMLFPH
jgi:nucleoside-diphosphate-sugar epimerase